MAANPDPLREFLRHTLATLAYRAAKTLREAPAGFADFQAGNSSRTPAQILAHMGDLFDWALAMAKGKKDWHDSHPLPWPQESARFFAALKAFDGFLASAEPLGSSVQKLFQGPVADALTHTGQLALLRRLAEAPVRAENYAAAEISAGRVGPEQTKPRREF
ncbi:MAG: hypothetical protein ACRD50_06870 [Candidatus Acidiferrales bacterium]